MKLGAQYLLEHVGVAVAAVTGVLAARGKRVDLFGVLVLALATAFGGGTVRDLALGLTPVFWVRDPNFVLTALGTGLVVFFVARSHVIPMNLLQVADALVLAFFTMVGLARALDLGHQPVTAVVMGVITGVVGGMLRDLLLGEIPLVFRPEIHLYATAAIAGATVCVVVLQWEREPQIAVWVGLTTTLLLRLAGIRWRISLPVFAPTGEPLAQSPDKPREDRSPASDDPGR